MTSTTGLELPSWLNADFLAELNALNQTYACGERNASIAITVHYQHGEARKAKVQVEKVFSLVDEDG